MEREFWLERWQQNLIGFHQQDINPHLQRYWSRLSLQPGDQVLVPLCGKSRDMCWLSEQGHQVLGVEFSERAVDDFFHERRETPERQHEGSLSSYSSGRIKLLCGDFFDLEGEQLQQVRAVYDRASLIALPPAMRERFVQRLTGLLPDCAELLLVSMEYPQGQMNGPPFAVPEAEIRGLFEPQWSIELLHEEDILANEPRFRERGLSSMAEKVYLLRRHQP